MSRPILTQEDWIWAAAQIGCDVAAVKAVAQVEAPKNGFLPSGKLTILFERHKFHKFTKGQYSPSLPNISNPKPGGYFGGEKEWSRFDLAAGLNLNAARLSTSWGKFQVMGFNFAVAGYASVEQMIADYEKGENEQLQSFVELIQEWGLGDEMRDRRWADFARVYNGANYRINQYDVKLAAAYKQHGGKS